MNAQIRMQDDGATDVANGEKQGQTVRLLIDFDEGQVAFDAMDESMSTLRDVVYRKVLADPFPDPLTLPQTSIKCLHKKWGICVEFSVKTRWLYVTPVLTVTADSEEELQQAVTHCLRKSAIAAALATAVAAYTTGGAAAASAGIATFERLLKICLTARLGEAVSVNFETETEWGDWV